MNKCSRCGSHKLYDCYLGKKEYIRCFSCDALHKKEEIARHEDCKRCAKLEYCDVQIEGKCSLFSDNLY